MALVSVICNNDDDGQVGQRIVADVFLGLFLEKSIPANLVHQLFPVTAAETGQLEQFPGVLIANESPVDAADEANGEHIGRRKMDEADIAHHVVIASLPNNRRQGIGDQVAGDGQGGDRQRIDPVPETRRRLVHVEHCLFHLFLHDSIPKRMLWCISES